MDLQCDICFFPFDVDSHRPKSLPCGHTICQECVLNPALLMKCPSCRKDMTVDPGSLPDNILAIRMIEHEHDGAPPCKVAKADMTQAQKMGRGVEAARYVVACLGQMVPQAVQGLESLLKKSADRLRQMEEALEREVGRRGEKEGDLQAPPADAERVAAWMDDSKRCARLLKTASFALTADQDEGEQHQKTWKASWKHGEHGADSSVDSVVRLLLLQLHLEDRLKQDADVDDHSTLFVGPPLSSALSITDEDLDDDGELKVDEIIREGYRWKHARVLNNAKGRGLDKLLRVVGPRLVELHIVDKAQPTTMDEVEKMKNLKRLSVECDLDILEDYPDLPLQLEELSLYKPSGNQMFCVQGMPKLRSLRVYDFLDPHMAFPPSPHGALLWLGVGLGLAFRDSMLKLIRSYAATLQELEVYCRPEVESEWYLPDLGPDLAGCGLKALRRLVLQRDVEGEPCGEAASCLLQRRTIKGFLSPSIEVICDGCADAGLIYT